MAKKQTKSKPNTWVCVYDIHFPKVHKPTLDVLLDFLSRNSEKIAGFVFGGDMLDNEEISHHTSRKPLYRPTGSYLRNHREFQSQILDPIQALLPKGIPKIWIDGNHEHFADQMVEVQPELQGLVENHLLLDVERQGWTYIPCGQRFKLGKLSIIHGETLSGTGNQASAFHAKKAVDLYAGSVLYGHSHTCQSYTRILPHDISQRWISQCSPILGRANPKYMRNAPNSWVNGFVIVETHSNGDFNIIPLVVSNGVLSYGGEEYGKKTSK